MGKETIESLVEGGKASAAPPLGPALGPLGVPIPKIIDEINRKTKALAGMKVPVKIIVNTDTKEFEIEVGTPPITALIKKELGLDKGSSEAGKVRAGNLKEDQVKKIAESKFGSADPRYVSQVRGTARSMGITIGEGELTEDELEAAKKSHEDAKTIETAPSALAPGAEGETEGEAPAEGEAPKEGEKPAAEEGEGKEEKKE